jgi:hypothetical protein
MTDITTIAVIVKETITTCSLDNPKRSLQWT